MTVSLAWSALISLCVSQPPSPSPSLSCAHLRAILSASLPLSPTRPGVLLDIRPSKLDAETTLLQHPILQLVPPPPAPPPAAPAAPAAPAPDFRRSRQAGGPAGGVPTGPAAVSVPSRRPRPLRADLTRTAASRRYKQRPGGEEGSGDPGPTSAPRLLTHRPQTPNLRIGAQDPGPVRGARAGQVTTVGPFSPRAASGTLERGALCPPSNAPRGEKRLWSSERAREGRCASTPGSSTAQAGSRRRLGAGTGLAVPPGAHGPAFGAAHRGEVRILRLPGFPKLEVRARMPEAALGSQDTSRRAWELEFESGSYRLFTVATDLSLRISVSELEIGFSLLKLAS